MNIEQLKHEKKKFDFYEFKNRRINEFYLSILNVKFLEYLIFKEIRNVMVTFKRTFLMGFNNISGFRKKNYFVIYILIFF